MMNVRTIHIEEKITEKNPFFLTKVFHIFGKKNPLLFDFSHSINYNGFLCFDYDLAELLICKVVIYSQIRLLQTASD